VKKNPQKETASETPMVEVLEKAAADAKSKHRKKDTKPTAASQEAHQTTFSLSDVYYLPRLLNMPCYPYSLFLSLQPSMQKFLSLGTKCLGIQKTANKTRGRYSHTLLTKGVLGCRY
jgi:hypothetical protein